MLTNHDMDSTSPLACLLVGQPTLRRNIKLGMLAALDQRIAIRYNMRPMTSEEIRGQARTSMIRLAMISNLAKRIMG